MQTESNRKLNLTLHLLFLFSGTATVLIGQLLPVLSKYYQLNDLQAGFYFPTQFAGSITGTIFTGIVAKRSGYLLATLAGATIMSVGLLLLNVDSFAGSLFAFALLGVGIGMTLPSINMSILEMNPLNSASALSVLNFCWGVGAIISKPFVDATHSGGNLRATTGILAIPMLVAAILLFIEPAKSVVSDQPEQDTEPLRIWSTAIAWAIAFFNFVHVGFESGMGGWLTTYSERVNGNNIGWLSPTLLYFVFFVVGRGVAPFAFRFLNADNMLLLGLCTVLAGMLLMLNTTLVTNLAIGASISGFGTSWIFPTNVARFSKIFGPAATRRATPLFVCGTLGAAAATWLIGFVSNQTGNLRLGMYVLVGGIVVLIVLQVILARITPSLNPKSSNTS